MNFFIINMPLLVLLAIFLVSCSKDTMDSQVDENATGIETEVGALTPIEIEILELLNAHRISEGLNVLNEMDIIRAQAYMHTEYMIEKNRLSHDNFVEREYYLTEHASAHRVSEIVAFGFDTAEEVVSSWLNSDGHRSTIEGNFSHFNVSAEKNEQGLYFFTCIFIRK